MKRRGGSKGARPPWRRPGPQPPAGAAGLALIYTEALEATTPGPARVVCELAERAPDCLPICRRVGIKGDALWAAYKDLAGEDVGALARQLRLRGRMVAAQAAVILKRYRGGG